LPSKDEAFVELLNKHHDGKFLVFSAHDQSFKGIEESLITMNHSCVKLVGSGHRLRNIVNEYKTGNLNVLLLNANHYGTGLNLENTTDLVFYHKMNTDMESQVIGRAQRFGRSVPLRIHYLFQENET
jgi:SNF2 family DNA or RNA helicase